MHDTSAHGESRIDRFIRERLASAVIRDRETLDVAAWHAPGEPVPFAVAAAADYTDFPMGGRWGKPWGTTWFRIRGRLPERWLDSAGELPDRTRALLDVDLGFHSGQPGFQSEGLLWTVDGVPIKGIAPRNSTSAAAIGDDGGVDVFIEAAANPDVGSDFSFAPTTLGDPATAGEEPIYVLRAVDVVLHDLDAAALLDDARVLRGLMFELPERSPRRARIRAALERMLDVVDPANVAGTAAAGREVLAPELAKRAHASAHVLHAVGHAHIDSAWLWPVRETVRKCSRTFSNAVSLMDEHPDFTFACSSAQQLAWVQEHYPALFERIRVKVAEGRFLPVGGMWVEADTNLPGGEALARQFVEGKRYFLDELGVECEEVWLPDSFGYTGALPQIARLAGMRWFLTQKISWNDTNRMPHHTFRWEGIDGTRIYTHFPPVDKYNSDLAAADLAYAERNFSDAARSTMSLLPYGYGDGGGGPTAEMTAIVDRTRSLEGSPRVEHSTPRQFFESVETEYPDAEVWVGELYLELHRGTYTSQRRTKVGNRRSEHLLREAELWAATASIRSGLPYPQQSLRRLWRLVLLQQFHDILPGSAIAWVHQDAERNYAAIERELQAIIETSLRALAGTGTHDLTVNAAPHARDGVAALGGAIAQPALPSVTPRREGRDHVLDNGRVRAVIDQRGLLVSLLDVESGRESVPPGVAGNLFQLHRDTPAQWDAWDIDDEYRHVVDDLTAAAAVEWDPEQHAIVVHRTFGASSLTQRIRLAPGSGGLDIDTEIDWHERQKLLKLAFPIDVHTDRFASEIQFGHIQRPTHTNTSWDQARYETCAHRWIHVAEPDYGVAIANDSVYGYDVTHIARPGGGGGATIARLSIVRSALFPDPEQDQGRHRFQISVLPGASVLDAVVAGYRQNLEPRTMRGAQVDTIAPIVRVEQPGVVVEAVKFSEDGTGDVVVRLYEALGRRVSTEVAFDFDAGTPIETDLLERPVAGVDALRSASRGQAMLELRPFQIVTLRVPRS